MQALIDFLPVVAFVATYWITGEMKLAILVIMAAISLQVALTWLVKKEVPKMLQISAVLVVGLGGISVFLDNPIFFKWKPTGLYWLFGLVLVGSHFIGESPLVKRMLNSMSTEAIRMPDAAWHRLNIAWAVFFFFAGAANIYVAYWHDEATWVNFKLFGLLALTLVFMIGQAFWITTQIEEPAESQETPSE
jgi:intracellular septation protein